MANWSATTQLCYRIELEKQGSRSGVGRVAEVDRRGLHQLPIRPVEGSYWLELVHRGKLIENCHR